MTKPSNPNDSDALEALKAVLAANDDKHLMWPAETVEYTRALYRKHSGRVPTINEVVQQVVGIERAERFFPEIVERRRFENALVGHGSPCHYCGQSGNLTYHPFGLMRVAETKREWGATIGTAALSTLTFPLIGAGALTLPGKSHSGQLFEMKLVVCKPCAKKEAGIFGVFVLKEKKAVQHPLWKPLQDAGFTKYVSATELPVRLPRA